MISILIVEENAEMRRMMRELVADLAGSIYECGDAGQALAMYRERRPDWVLMDIQMVEPDGLAATRRIKQAFPSANILIISNYDDPRMRAAARQSDARGYVLKENLIEMRNFLAARNLDV